MTFILLMNFNPTLLELTTSGLGQIVKEESRQYKKVNLLVSVNCLVEEWHVSNKRRQGIIHKEAFVTYATWGISIKKRLYFSYREVEFDGGDNHDGYTLSENHHDWFLSSDGFTHMYHEPVRKEQLFEICWIENLGPYSARLNSDMGIVVKLYAIEFLVEMVFELGSMVWNMYSFDDLWSVAILHGTCHSRYHVDFGMQFVHRMQNLVLGWDVKCWKYCRLTVCSRVMGCISMQIFILLDVSGISSADVGTGYHLECLSFNRDAIELDIGDADLGSRVVLLLGNQAVCLESVFSYHVREMSAVGMHLRHYMVYYLLITVGFVRHVPSLKFRLLKAPE